MAASLKGIGFLAVLGVGELYTFWLVGMSLEYGVKKCGADSVFYEFLIRGTPQ